MKYVLSLLVCMLVGLGTVNAQAAAEALKTGKETLNERYLVLKSKSQTYQDYKVVKEYVLDGMWKIVQDSMAVKAAAVNQARLQENKAKQELTQVTAALKEKEASMAEVTHASTHITVLGIDFQKSFFVTMISIVLLVLVALVALMVARVKMVHMSLKQREDVFNTLSAEYEDYKRKAMDKQTKLSRELQTERNKIQGLRSV